MRLNRTERPLLWAAFVVTLGGGVAGTLWAFLPARPEPPHIVTPPASPHPPPIPRRTLPATVKTPAARPLASSLNKTPTPLAKPPTPALLARPPTPTPTQLAKPPTPLVRPPLAPRR